MTKRKMGEFDLTWREREKMQEWIIADSLAMHYEKMAQTYRERAARKQLDFWNEVRERDLPKVPVQFRTTNGRLVIERLSKDPPQVPHMHLSPRAKEDSDE